ncbi:hypothetical protein CP532_1283 [Ophiocordyceps camponoti-leonardi (nom. inval.)]|nr:hypothetical protein CP532_1283 [Ophiocordyceps camponoti-leonardi (nom. inval.)]
MLREIIYFVTSLGSAGGLIAAFAIPRARPYLHSPWPVLALGVVLIVACSRYRHLRQMRLHGTLPGTVYPHIDPILGIDWMWLLVRNHRRNRLLEMTHTFFTQSVATTYWTNILGNWMLMTCDPENFKAIMSDQSDAWDVSDTRAKSLGPALGKSSILAVNGRLWWQARTMIRPMFSQSPVTELNCIDHVVDNCLARVRSAGDKVELKQLIYMFNLDASTKFMFGHSTNLLDNPSAASLEFRAAFSHAVIVSSTTGRLGWLAPLLRGKDFHASVATCRAYASRYVDEAMKDEKAEGDAYFYIRKMREVGGSYEQTTDQLLTLLLVGHDTSSCVMSCLFWTLARRPDVVRAIRQELQQLGGRRPTWQQLRGLKYLFNVYKEALRLWTPTAFNSRTALKDLVLPKGGGPDHQSPLFVPKGTECAVSLHSLHRLNDIFGDDAKEFRPERWESSQTNPANWEYQPFGIGPRTCVGQQFAWTMMPYFTARFFQEYESIEALDDDPMMLKLTAGLGLGNDCWVALTPASTE